jgi:HAD superfamily hydrolase (TIGR01484 family)
MKELIVFDLDGTIAESKSRLDDEMSALLRELLSIVKVAVISGGNWPQFEKQLVSNLPRDANLENLSLLPTCGTKFYKYGSAWEELYSENFIDEEKAKIIDSLHEAIGSMGFNAEIAWGELIEDRGSQITFSALGREAPLEEKKKWDPDFSKRKQIKAFLDKSIPEFSVRLGGTASVDVTKQGIDKASGTFWASQSARRFLSGTPYSRAETTIRPKKQELLPSRSEIPMRRNELSKQSLLV